MKITIGITDDHQLIVKSLALLIDTFSSFRVTLEALNGVELLKQMASITNKPDIVLLDVDMPKMNGIFAAQKMTELYPEVKLVALTMKEEDTTIINMVRGGCCAYLLKDIHPVELEKALNEVYTRGEYNADPCNISYRRLLKDSNKAPVVDLKDRELTFLQLACSDLTYKQIASEMHLAERTIDGYREVLFQKFNVQSRVGMALEAIRRKYVPLELTRS